MRISFPIKCPGIFMPHLDWYLHSYRPADLEKPSCQVNGSFPSFILIPGLRNFLKQIVHLWKCEHTNYCPYFPSWRPDNAVFYIYFLYRFSHFVHAPLAPWASNKLNNLYAICQNNNLKSDLFETRDPEITIMARIFFWQIAPQRTNWL